MKVLVAGSRNWKTDEQITKILNELERLPSDTIIVHGACHGVDMIADAIAFELGFTVKQYPANWNKHRRSAGPIRNIEMYDAEQPFDLVLAFHEDISLSKGTKHMVSVVHSKSPLTSIKIIT